MWLSQPALGSLPRNSLHPFWRLSILLCLLVPGYRLQAEGLPSVLPPRTLTSLAFDAGAALSFSLDASGSSQAEVFMQASVPGVQLTVLSPSGQPVETSTIRHPGWAILSFRCAQQGQYHIEATINSSHDDVAGAMVRADFLRFPVADAQMLAKAEEQFAEARSLAHSPLQAPVRDSIEKFRQARIAWEAIDDREGQILALAGEAQARLDLSENAASLAALDQARILSAQIPLLDGWLASRQAQVYLDRMDSQQAAKYSEQAFSVGRNLNDAWLKAESLADLAESEYFVRAPSAGDDVREAIRLSRQVHAVLPLARALRCSAWIEQDAGRMTRALALLHQAEDGFQQAGDSRDAAIGMSDMANNQALSGDPYTALVRQSALIPLIRRSGKRSYLEYLFTSIAQNYARLNRIPDAVVFSKKALQLSRNVAPASDEAGVAIELNQLCELEQRNGELHQALGDCRKALAIFKQIHDPKLMAVASWQLGKVQRAVGRPDEAIPSFRLASRMSESVRAAWPQPQSLMDWGDTLESLGEDAQARALFEKAVSISQASEDPSSSIDARYRIARSEFRAGQTQQAKRDLQILVDSIEAQRRTVADPDLQASFFAQMHQCHELLIELLMREDEQAPGSGAAEQALDVSESGRARTLLEVLSAREDSAGAPHHTGASRELAQLHLSVDRFYDQRLKLMLEGAGKPSLDANTASLTQAIDALERREDEESAGTPAPSSLPPEPAFLSQDFARASQTLHSTLIEYALGTERSFVWVIDSGTIHSYMLPGRGRIESAVRRWRALATARIAEREWSAGTRQRIAAADRKLPSVAADLSCMLLAPFLRPDMNHLVLVPDGELNLLPFAALPENGCQHPGQPIAAKREVTLTPSFSVLLSSIQSSRPRPISRDVAILADPVFDRDDPRVHRAAASLGGETLTALAPALPRLFGAREEAKAIAAAASPGNAALYLDFKANVRTLFDPSLRQYGILHLATHGIADGARPEFSGIVLSLVNHDGQPILGYLNAHNIAESDLPFDLVVLSSCDSAAGLNLTGEGVLGLNHAFLSAGARRIVSTLWTVDDDASRELMADFYQGMLRKGLDPSEALRLSQVKIMSNPRTASPFYWAGFTITSTVD